MKVAALIPARSGSRRLPDKNIKKLNGHPLIAHTISQATNSGVFEKVFLCTDSEVYAEAGKKYGAECPHLRSADISGSHSPDIEWVSWAIGRFSLEQFDALAILRPFRTPSDIAKALEKLKQFDRADSVRAVSKCSVHPAKMWVSAGDYITPLLPFSTNKNPWHSQQTASLPEVFFQNASLEIAWTQSIIRTRTIAGDIIIPYFSEGYSGFDINEPDDFSYAEFLIANGKVKTLLNGVD